MQTESTRLPAAAEFQQAVANENAVEVSIHTVANLAVQQFANALVQSANEAQAIESITTADDLPTEKQFFSIGHACQLLQIAPATLRAVMKEASVRFAELRNDICFLDGKGLLAVGRKIKELRSND